MSENEEIYTAGKKFTLPPAVTAWTNLTSAAKCSTLYVAHPDAEDGGDEEEDTERADGGGEPPEERAPEAELGRDQVKIEMNRFEVIRIENKNRLKLILDTFLDQNNDPCQY